MKTSGTPSPPNNPTSSSNPPHPSYQHPFPHNNTHPHNPPPPPSSQPSPYPQQGTGGYGSNIPQHASYPNGPSYNSNGQNGHSSGNSHHNGPNMPMTMNHGGQQIGHPNDNINGSRKFMNNSTHHSHHQQSIPSSAPNNSQSSVYQTPHSGHVVMSSNSHISSSNTQMSYSNTHMSSSNNHMLSANNHMSSSNNHMTLQSQSGTQTPAPSQLPTSGNKQQLIQQHQQHNGHNNQQQVTSHLQYPSQQQKYHNNNNNSKMGVEPGNSGPTYRAPNFGLNGGHHPFAPSNYVQQHHSNSNAPTPTIVSSINNNSSTMAGAGNMQSKPVFTQANESSMMKPTTSTSYPQSGYSKSAGGGLPPSKPYPPSSLSAALSLMAATHNGHILQHPAHPTPPPYQPPPPTPSNLEINPPNPISANAQNSTAVAAAPPPTREPIRYEGEDLSMVAHPDLCRRLIASKTELKKLASENNNYVSELNKKIQVQLLYFSSEATL